MALSTVSRSGFDEIDEQTLLQPRRASVEVDESGKELRLPRSTVVILHDPLSEAMTLSCEGTGRIGHRNDSVARRSHRVQLVDVEEPQATGRDREVGMGTHPQRQQVVGRKRADGADAAEEAEHFTASEHGAKP